VQKLCSNADVGDASDIIPWGREQGFAVQLRGLLKTLVVVGVTSGESGLQTHPLIFPPLQLPPQPQVAATALRGASQNS
jgi:hypothetical protein